MSRPEMVAGNFSNVDAAGGASPYVAYLDRARIALEETRQFGNTLLDLKPGDRLLDAGCGTGDALHDLARIVGPHGRAVGVDASEKMLEEARKRTAHLGLPISFEHADVNHLPFNDNEFNACSAERIFVHLESPATAIGELVRVLKPGGCLVIREADLEMVMLDSADHKTARAIWNFFSAGVRNGYIGRQLYGLFHQQALENVAVHPRPITTNSLEIFNTILPFEATARTAAEKGIVDPGSVDALVDDLYQRDASGRFFGCVIAFIAVGRKT
jgi:ubiquinone/menaquinone biosynthesis C-methylase UbiE